MAHPAPASTDGPQPGNARPRKSDPHSPGWADVRAAMILQAEAMRLDVQDIRRAVEDLRDSPADPRKLDATLEMAAVQIEIAERWEILARRQKYDEATLEAYGDQRYAQGVADCKAARCHLEAVP